MAKPYRFRNLLALFVFVVLILSGILSATGYMILRGLKLLPPAIFSTVWMPLVLLMVSHLVAAVVNYFFVPKVLKPIESLMKATKQVAKGDFAVRVPSENLVGELKELTDSFNAMTEELGNTEIFRSDFIRDFSHEFKTPIVSLSGFAKQLKNPELSREEFLQYCDIIISESDRLSKMSSNILLLSKFENQQIVSDKRKFSLDEQLRDCMLLLEKEWTDKELELELDLDSVFVEQNEEMLRQIWINLFSNAVKFTPRGGWIRVSLTDREDTIAVAVQDNGIGMTENEKKHIFDKCYQADPSHSGSGNGLGLCIVKRVCTLCGGSISVSSRPGEGSCFTVTLPKA